jgi:hypothetical protein
VKRGKPRENLKPSSIILDMRRYNPLTAHLLAQSYVYPDSNGLSQTDRGIEIDNSAPQISECTIICGNFQQFFFPQSALFRLFGRLQKLQVM